jgi:predicted TIM-barrel fold metal-dependent hydrolase
MMLESIDRFDVDGRVKQKILGANAARLLGL